MSNRSYDDRDPADIERFGARLLGKTLRSVPGMEQIPAEYFEASPGTKEKGTFGALVERFYFGICPGNKACSPDFTKAGVELKTHPFTKLKHGYGAKERLVLGMINYRDIVNETYESSCFMSKSRKIMLVSREVRKNQKLLDSEIILAKLIDLDRLPEVDQKIIKQDWQIIADKVRSGSAHLLSGSDTTYLEAATKGADGSVRVAQPFSEEMARPRAFALKAGYVTDFARAHIGEAPPESVAQEALVDATEVEDLGFEQAIIRKFRPYLGTEIGEIESRLGSDINRDAKGYFATLSRQMLGVETTKIAEFERADVTLKASVVHQNGLLREHTSFPAFKYMGPGSILEEEWEAEEEERAPAIRTQLEQRRFCSVVFEKSSFGTRLSKVVFWSMSHEDINRFVRPVWELTREAIRSGSADDLPGSSFNHVCHVRPHGRNREDTRPTPHNGNLVKKSFWLDKRYIQSQIDR